MTDLVPHRASVRLTFLDAIHDPALITHLRGDSNYCWVHYADARSPYLICRALKELEGYLPAFLRVSKQHLVNPAFIGHLLVGIPGTRKDLVLTTGMRVQLSRRRAVSLREELANYPRQEQPAEADT